MQAPNAPAWLRRIVAPWLLKYTLLGLPGTPASEHIDKTAAVWCEALLACPVAWDEAQDAPRLHAAFKALLPQLERWPAPRHLLAHLPARAPVLPLPPPPANAANRERALAMLADIANAMRSNVPTPPRRRRQPAR